jgi:type VI secretion system protein ImpK
MLIETAAPPARAAAVNPSARRGQLALVLQEAFTVAVRLRANRQVASSSDAFRQQVKALLANADREARQHGYDGGDTRSAVYAYIAFLDETALHSTQSMFAAWAQQPLQEEVFGDHMAGETFFRNLGELMARQDSEDLGDVLEVYLLCMLLGFRGRHAAHPATLQGAMESVRERLQRIRGTTPVVGPDWALPVDESPPATRDPWLRRLLLAAGGALLLAVVLYAGFRFSLGVQVAELRALGAALTR